MQSVLATYPIGTPGIPWGAAERALWLSRQTLLRSYDADVLQSIDTLRPHFDVLEYGRLNGPARIYPVLALCIRPWRDGLPAALVTGGVHGYETSGVRGALRFAAAHAQGYAGRVNLVIAPCVSPWAYEAIQRWNPDAIDPNRSFRQDSPAPEAAALMQLVASRCPNAVLHVDLHETTDTDASEFGPALAARDGKPFVRSVTPDGFYVVDDAERPQPEFQKAIIDAVAKVTHIASADANGEIIGSPVVAPGVIRYPLRELGLCAGMTEADFKTTTEVYPDGLRITPEQCIAAQVAAVLAALDFVLT
jgi:hypothetical protein